MTVELTRAQYETLLYVLGYAAVQAKLKKDTGMFIKAVKMANLVGPADPRFRPYEIPAEAKL